MPHAKLTNVETVRGAILFLADKTDRELEKALSTLASEARYDFRLAAPRRRGILQAGIRTRRTGTWGFDVTIHARDPESGYDYAGVTRFGHRFTWIYPTQGEALLVHLPAVTLLRSRVRGYNPDHDWVEDAMPLVSKQAREVMTDVGQALEIRVFS